MPNTESAKKSLRISERKRVFNARRRRAVRSVLKNVRVMVRDGKARDAEELLPKAYQALDKAAKRGVIKKNTAARKKSRLVRMIRAHASR